MATTKTIFVITFSKRASTGDSDARDSCYLKQNTKRDLNPLNIYF